MILVLRPEPGASETVRRARALGLEARAVPLFTIEPIDWEVPEASHFDALLLTSANAPAHAGERLTQLRGLPVHAVGDATAMAARAAGFDIASTGDAGIDRLLGSIDPGLRLLHLCGADRRAPHQPQQAITALPVYRARPSDPPDLGDLAGDIALIHSPRAGTRLADLVGDRSSIIIAAISEAAAHAVGGGWQKVETADQPSDEAVLALAARLCHKPGGE